MTIAELQEILENLIQEGVPEYTEVRLQSQPGYPHDNRIAGLALNSKMNPPNEEEIADAAAHGATVEPEPEVVYICEGSWVGYGSRNAWEDMIL